MHTFVVVDENGKIHHCYLCDTLPQGVENPYEDNNFPSEWKIIEVERSVVRSAQCANEVVDKFRLNMMETIKEHPHKKGIKIGKLRKKTDAEWMSDREEQKEPKKLTQDEILMRIQILENQLNALKAQFILSEKPLQ